MLLCRIHSNILNPIAQTIDHILVLNNQYIVPVELSFHSTQVKIATPAKKTIDHINQFRVRNSRFIFIIDQVLILCLLFNYISGSVRYSLKMESMGSLSAYHHPYLAVCFMLKADIILYLMTGLFWPIMDFRDLLCNNSDNFCPVSRFILSVASNKQAIHT